MRSSLVRFVGTAVIVTALLVGMLIPVSAQETTPEAAGEEFTSEMMMMHSSCPQNVVATLVAQLVVMRMTEVMPDMAATEDMIMTEEAPMMEATEDMMMTEEAPMGPLCLVGEFRGDAEVPGPGDEDGLGLAFVTFDSMTGEVCYEIAVANIELPAQAMHIHTGEAGISGGVVIPFPTAPDADGYARGCTTAEDMTVVEGLATNPEGYYVNVHTSDFPDGAVRAQLMPLEEGRTMMEDMGLQMFDLRGDTFPETTLEPPPGS